jgi:opacity protein-like surface antigen
MSALRRALAVLLLVPTIAAPVLADPPPVETPNPERNDANPLQSAPTMAGRGRLLEVAAFAEFGSLSFAASRSFDAVLGSSSGRVLGGGGEMTFVRGRLRGVFVRVDASRFRETGERVFVSQGQVFELGIPLTVTVTPIELTGGYRFTFRSRGGEPFPLVPYAGLGIGTVQYQEESSFAEAGDDVDERFTSYHVLGGVDVPIWRWLAVGVEGHYRWVPDGLGASGVSREFNETNLGGATIRAKVGVRF